MPQVRPGAKRTRGYRVPTCPLDRKVARHCIRVLATLARALSLGRANHQVGQRRWILLDKLWRMREPVRSFVDRNKTCIEMRRQPLAAVAGAGRSRQMDMKPRNSRIHCRHHPARTRCRFQCEQSSLSDTLPGNRLLRNAYTRQTEKPSEKDLLRRQATLSR